MKSIYIFSGLLFLALITVAQGNYEKDGLTYTKDGKLLNGRCVQISDEDQTKKVFHYEDGLLNGEFLLYAANGNLLERGEYLRGQKHGKWTSWNIESLKTGEAFYNNGQKDGKWQVWDEKGVLRYVMFYEAGEKVGNWQIFAENGDLLQEKNYTETL
jgi:antitoxin component YwqK of YwqJK toxin-antitoxin module